MNKFVTGDLWKMRDRLRAQFGGAHLPFAAPAAETDVFLLRDRLMRACSDIVKNSEA